MQHDASAKPRDRMRQPPANPVRVDTERPFDVKPGALRGESSVIIKTRLAQRLVFGRASGKNEPDALSIIGLVGFAGMVKKICTGARLDDPYADKWLLDIDRSIDASVNRLGSLRGEVDQALLRRSDFAHKIAHSMEPIEVPLYFSSPLPFKAAYLINDFDNLVCAALTAKHVAAMVVNDADKCVRYAGKAVRRAMSSAHGYQYTGVSRADLAHKTAKAQKALELWGELPVEILDGSLRSSTAPPLPEKSYAHHIAEEHAKLSDIK